MELNHVYVGNRQVLIDGHPVVVEADGMTINPIGQTGISVVEMGIITNDITVDSNMRSPAAMETTPIHDQLAQEYGVGETEQSPQG